MTSRDCARKWNRNGRRLMRDRSGRLMGSTRFVLTAIQVRAVERLWRTGVSVEAIATEIRVPLRTLYRRLADQLSHLERRGRSRMDCRRRDDPTPEQISEIASQIRVFHESP